MADPFKFQPLCIDPHAPTKFHQYLQGDEPQLGLVIASFEDATLVSLSWTHLLFDAVGFGELLYAWSLMVQGRRGEILKPFGTEHDALADLGLQPTQTYRLSKFRLSWFGAIIFYVRTLFEMIWFSQQSRMIYVPGQFIRQLRNNAVSELASENHSGASDQRLSDGDIICAWWAKMNTCHLTGSNKLVHLANALGWRSTLAEDWLPSDRPYISNAFGFFSVLIPAKDIFFQVNRPLGLSDSPKHYRVSPKGANRILCRDLEKFRRHEATLIWTSYHAHERLLELDEREVVSPRLFCSAYPRRK